MQGRSQEEVYAYHGRLVSLSDSIYLRDMSQAVVKGFGARDTAPAGQRPRPWPEAAGAGGIGEGRATLALSLSLPGQPEITLEAGQSLPVSAAQAGAYTEFRFAEAAPTALLAPLSQAVEAALRAALPEPEARAAWETQLCAAQGLPDLKAYLHDQALLVFDLSASASVLLCFAAGTLIETAAGARPVETLGVGDLVQTLDNGLQPLCWVGSRKVPARGEMAPVHFTQGVLGNRRGLTVSPQHRMLIRSPRAELLFGDHEVLVAARHLVNGQTIYRREGGFVDYVHLLFRRPEIVFSEGVPSESFHPAERSLAGFAPQTRAEILRLFPELAGPETRGLPSARPTLKGFEAALLEA